MTVAKSKILFVVEAMGGGVFTYIVDLANELVNVYDVYIAYAIRPQTPIDFKKYFNPNIHLIEVKNFARSINPVKDILALFELKMIAKSIDPDIIHLHSSKAGAIGRVVFNGKKHPLFYTPHGYSFLMENYNPLKRFLFKSIETILAKRKCTTISCSYGEYLETKKFNNHATYVNNGINTEKLGLLLSNVTEKDHPFTVFTLGRICYQKNPDLFNSVAKAMPDVRFLWIGDGDMRDVLTSPNIEIVGWVDRKKALELSVNADVFLLTSLWEGLPISILEAMYIKKLCVVSDVTGNHDVIHNGRNGFVCQTIDDYVNAISSKNTEKLIDTAYNDIVTEYNTNVMARKYVQIYQSAMK